VKKSSAALSDEDGEFEYHWYERHGLGPFEIRRIDLQDSG